MDPFIKRLVKQVQEHAPSCLSGFRVSPPGAESWNDWAGWSLACSCGATQGKVLGHSLKDCNPKYDGSPVFVSPLAFECSACGKTTEIIDTQEHGYNSEIGKLEGGGGDSNYRGSGERQPIPCPQCNASEFSVTARFLHSHFDLIDDEPELEPRAQEFFDGFDCVGKCAACNAESSLAGFELA